MAHGFKHGAGGDPKKVPVLNDEYPKDVSVEAVGSEVNFTVLIAENGKPSEYEYQWYYDGTAVNGATEATYTMGAEFGSHTVFCVVTNEAGMVTSREATVTAETQYIYNNGVFDTVAGTLARSNDKNNLSIDDSSLRIWSSLNAWGHVYFTNKVDLTPFKTLYVDLSVSITGSGENWGQYTFGVYKEVGSSVAAGISGARGRGTYTVDVSGLTGEYYIGAYLKGWAAYADSRVYEVYLK